MRGTGSYLSLARVTEDDGVVLLRRDIHCALPAAVPASVPAALPAALPAAAPAALLAAVLAAVPAPYPAPPTPLYHVSGDHSAVGGGSG